MNILKSAARVTALATVLGFGLAVTNVAHAELGCLVAGAISGAANPKAPFYTNAACEALGKLAEEAGQSLGEYLAEQSNEEYFGGGGGGKTYIRNVEEFEGVGIEEEAK